MNPNDLIDSVTEQQAQQEEQKTEQTRLDAIKSVGKEVSDKIVQATNTLIRDKQNPAPVNIQNKLATPEDIQKVVDTLKQVAVDLKPESIEWEPVLGSLNKLSEQLSKLPTEIPESPEPLEEVSIKNISDVKGYIQPLIDEIKKLELSPTFDPQIQVKPADVKITTEKIDTKPLVDAIGKLQKGFEDLASKEAPEQDITPLVEATRATTDAITALRFPVPNYVLPFKDHDGKATQASIDSDNGGVIVNQVGKLVKYNYDELDLGYTGTDLTSLTFKNKGSTTTLLNLSYSGGQLTSIVRQ